MKLTIIALILFSATLSLAQASTPTKTTSDPSPATAAQEQNKIECCCQKMMDGMHSQSCCSPHEEAAAMAEMPCPHDKDGMMAMSCMSADKNESAAMSKSGKNPPEDKKPGSGEPSHSEHDAMNCCEAMAGHCGMAHEDHSEMKK